MPGITSTLYNAVFKRTSTFLLVVVGSTFFFERTVDLGAEKLFDKINEGKLWKDVKHRFE